MRGGLIAAVLIDDHISFCSNFVIEKGHETATGYWKRVFNCIVVFCYSRNCVEEKPWVVFSFFNQADLTLESAFL